MRSGAQAGRLNWMGRRRRRVNEDLPKYVYQKAGWWVYREYLGVIDGKVKFAPDKYLCRLSAPRSELWREYERVTQKSKDTLRWMLEAYHKSRRFKTRQPRTQQSYEGYKKQILAKTYNQGRSIGDLPLTALKRPFFADYLGKHKDKHGRHAPIAANRHIQYLKAVWNWAAEYYEHVPDNPLLRVTLNKQKPRDRYVTDEEYKAFKAAAHSYIPLFMELAYLCRARWGEIARLRVSSCYPEGLELIRGKGSESEITAWTSRLHRVVDDCKAFNKSAPTPIDGAYLIHDKQGEPINKESFNSMWQRLMKKWVHAGNERFTFHDLKAKGVTDQAQNFAGHKSARMRKVYVRNLQLVEPPG